MLQLNPQFIVDENEKKTGVILSLKKFEKVLEILEELYDYRTLKDYKYDLADTIPIEAVSKKLKKKNNK